MPSSMPHQLVFGSILTAQLEKRFGQTKHLHISEFLLRETPELQPESNLQCLPTSFQVRRQKGMWYTVDIPGPRLRWGQLGLVETVDDEILLEGVGEDLITFFSSRDCPWLVLSCELEMTHNCHGIVSYCSISGGSSSVAQYVHFLKAFSLDW